MPESEILRDKLILAVDDEEDVLETISEELTDYPGVKLHTATTFEKAREYIVSFTYDLVILDAPPLLGFAEPLQMATAVDGVVVVTRAGQTTRKAVSVVMSTLTRLRANVVGLVLNEVYKEMSDSYYYYGYYSKYYGRTNGRNGTSG